MGRLITLLALLTAGAAATPAHPLAATVPVRATADFDGDGYGDLAVGVPGEAIGGLIAAGVVQVLYGSANGLTARRSQMWHQGVPGVLGSAESYDAFGHAVAGGDFDGDGFGDLAIGVPSETVGDEKKQGVVQVLYGSATGLTASGNELWRQGADGVPGTGAGWERFGATLAVGDFDADGRADLAAAAPFDQHRGTVTVLNGVPGGLQAGPSFSGPAGAGEAEFGHALAAGDFDGSGVDDLAVGAPGASRTNLAGETVRDAGLVTVLFGSAGSGLSTTGSVTVDQDSPSVAESVEHGDRFGSAVAAGDVDADGDADLAVSAPLESLGTGPQVGVVHLLVGTQNGPAGAGGRTFEQGINNVPGKQYRYDAFGLALTFGNFNGDAHADLAIGTPFDDEVRDIHDTGSVVVLYGKPGGLSTDAADLWHQDRSGFPGTAEPSDWLGYAISGGDYDDDGDEELAIGTVREGFSGQFRAGVVSVLRGGPTGIVTSGAQMWHQDIAGVAGEAEQGDGFGHALEGSRRSWVFAPVR